MNHSDEPGGSTLGNISNSHVSIKTADIGLAQLAMHSSYEVAGIEDIKALRAFAKAFYEDRMGRLMNEYSGSITSTENM